MRSLLDANILLRSQIPSTIPTRAVTLIMNAALARRYTLLLPPELVAEVLDKASTKPYLAARIGAERAAAFMALLREVGETLPPLPKPIPSICRDPDDDYLFAYAAAGRADYLVSDDADVHAVDASKLPFAIVTATEFLAVLRSRGLL